MPDLPPPMTEQRAARLGELERSYGQVLSQVALFAPHARVAFELRDTLGEGGMGRVYRVRDKRLRRNAALKVMSQGQDSGSRQRFLREARITASLDHPAIPPVFEAGLTAAGELYMLMRLIDGQTLSETIQSLRPYNFESKDGRLLLQALLKVSEAVAYAHSRGVLHRDLKPDNIMIGSFGEVLLMDWGIARDHSESASEEASLLSRFGSSAAPDQDLPGLTKAGSFLGTPGYAAPEQIDGGEVDERADVFSLGLILTEILTGQAAIEGETGTDRARATAAGQIRGPRELDASIAAELDWIARRATELDKNQRTESAARLCEELKAWLEGEDLPGYRYSIRERALRSARRRPALLLSLLFGSLLSLVSGVLILALRDAQRAAAELEASQQAEARARDEAERARRATQLFNEAQDLARRGVERESLRKKLEEALVQSQRSYQSLLQAASIAEEGRDSPMQRELLEEASERHQPAYEALFALHDLIQNETPGDFRATRPMEELIRRARERGDENEFTQCYRAIEFHIRKDYASALHWYNLAATQMTRVPLVYGNRGLVRKELGDPKGAREDFELAISLAPRYSSAYNNRGSLNRDEGRLEAALADYNKAISLDPENPKAYYNRGILKKAQGALGEALADFERALAFEQRYSLAYYQRACIREMQGNQAGALADFDKVVELEPKFSAAVCSRGVMKMKINDLQGALADFGRAIELEPEHDTAYFNRGRLRSTMGDTAGALADYDKAIALKTQDSRPYNNRGQIRLAAGDVAGAREDYDMAIRLDPKDPVSLNNRATLRRDQKDINGAYEDFQRAIDAAPNHSWAYANRGNLSLSQGDLKGALADLDKAASLDSELPQIYGSRGQVYYKLGPSTKKPSVTSSASSRPFRTTLSRGSFAGRFDSVS